MIETDDNIEGIVKIKVENVAKVETMIKKDSAYIRSGDELSKPVKSKKGNIKYPGSSAYWITQLKDILIKEYKESSDNYTYEECIKESINAIDRENSPHLNADGVGRNEISERIMRIKRDKMIIFLKEPEKDNYELIKVISESTTGGRKNPLKNDLRVYSSKGITYIDRKHVELTDRIELIDSFKVIITYAMSGGNKPTSNNDYMVIPNTMKVIGPGEICSETYLCVGNFKERNLATNLKKYIATKFFRFLLLQALSSIYITKDKFCFVPVQNFVDKSDILWSKSIREIDIQLYKKYNLTDDEISYIESKIKEME